MTTYYVDPGGSNTAPYDTAAKAATAASTIAALDAAGDRVLIGSTYAGTETSLVWTGAKANPVVIVSVDISDDSYLPGASNISAGALAWTGHHHTYGVTLGTAATTAGDLTLSGSDLHYKFFDSEIQWGDVCTIGGIDVRSEFRDVVLNHLGASSEPMDLGTGAQEGSYHYFNRISLTGNAGAGSYFFEGGGNGEGAAFRFENSDLSGWGAMGIHADLNQGMTCHVLDCKLPTGGLTAGLSAIGNNWLTIERCSISGTDTPDGLYHHKTIRGTVDSTLAAYRTVGANDGEQANAHSWTMTSDATHTQTRTTPLRTPTFSRWVAGGSEITLTVALAHNGIGGGTGGKLLNEEFWLEFSTPDLDAGAQGHNITTKPGASASIPFGDPQTAAADLATDSASTWVGSLVGTKEEASITFTPNYAGPVRVVACLSLPNVAIQLDPKVEVA